MTTSAPTITFWPRTQRSPMRAPGITWQKCQIFVPAPIVQGSSMTAVG
jgi:hypothetical protein